MDRTRLRRGKPGCTHHPTHGVHLPHGETGSFVFLHLLLLAGPFVALLYFSGARGSKDPITRDVVGSSAVLSLIAACFLYANWYGVRGKLRGPSSHRIFIL